MITLEQYQMGRKAQYSSEWTKEVENNATLLLGRVNALLKIYGKYPTVSSGWRPASINASIANAAKRSLHMTGMAIDLADPNGELDAWCLKNQSILKQLSLWQESPDHTKSWCHLDIGTRQDKPAPHTRVFKP